MDGGALLKAYNLPSNDKFVFVYDRRLLQSETPPEVVLPNIEVRVSPSPPLPLQTKASTHPVIWQLIEFENEFLGHLNIADATKKALDARIEICNNLLEEQKAMLKGLRIAMLPLDENWSQVSQAYDVFQSIYKPQSEQQDILLGSFEENMRKLGETRIHTGLTSSGANTLLDVVPELKLRKWAEECGNQYSQLKSRVSDLEKQYRGTRDAIESERNKPSQIDINVILQSIKEAEDIRQEVTLCWEMFTSDYKSVKDRLNLSYQAQKSTLSEGIPQLREKHMAILVKLQIHDQKVKIIMQACGNSKSRVSRYVHERLRTISALQQKNRELANKIVAFHEAIQRQKNDFFQLVFVQKMPRAYQSSLEEVVKRRKYKRRISALISRITEVLTKVREDEVTRRKGFLENHGRFIPKDLIPGLNEGVPPFEVSVPNFDVQLPQIDMGASTLTVDDEVNMLLSEGLGHLPSDNNVSNQVNFARITELEREVERLNAEVKAASSKSPMTSPSNTVGHNAEHVVKLQAELSQSQAASIDYKKRINELEVKLSETYSKVERAENLLKHYREKYESDLEVTKSQVIQSQEVQFRLDQKYKEAQAEVEELHSKLKDAENLLQEFEGNQEKLKELENTARQYAQQEQKYSSTIDLLQKAKSDIESQLAELTVENDESKTNVDKLKIQVSQKDSEIKKLSASITDLQKQIENLNTSISHLQKEKQEFSRKVQELSEATSKQQQQMLVLSQSTGKSEETSKYFQSEIQKLERKIKDLEEKSLADQIKIGDLQSVLDLQKTRSAKLEEEKKQLNQQIEDSFRNSNKAVEEKNWIIRQLNDKLTKTGQSTTSLEEEKKKLQSLLTQANDKSEKLEGRIKSDNELVDSLKLKIQKMETEGQSKNQTEKLMKQLEEKEAQLQSINKKYLEVNQNLELANKNYNEAQIASNTLRSKSKTLSEDLEKLRTAVRKIEGVLPVDNGSNDTDEDLVILRERIRSIADEREMLSKKLLDTEDHLKATEFNLDKLKRKIKDLEGTSKGIAFGNYKEGDYVLFLQNKQSVYEAFPLGNNYYLSPEALEAFEKEKKESKPIVGPVVAITQNKASTMHNPFKVSPGTDYYEILIWKENH